MSRLLDGICHLRDLIDAKDYKKLEQYRFRIMELNRQFEKLIKEKAENHKFELDFTAQDLRELASDIKGLFKHFENSLSADKAIKKLAKEGIEIDKNGNKILKVDFDQWTLEKTPVMRCRTILIQPLTELLTKCEFFAVYLYYVELVSNDEFAINYTERLFKWEGK